MIKLITTSMVMLFLGSCSYSNWTLLDWPSQSSEKLQQHEELLEFEAKRVQKELAAWK